MNWKNFAAGLRCGLLIGSGSFYLFGERYRIVSSGPAGIMTIRIDSWTGESWMGRYYDNKNAARIWYWELMKAGAS